MAKLKVDKSKTLSNTLVVCPACGSEVKKRGLRNHQQSDYCKAHQRRIEAEQNGLVPLSPSVEKMFAKHKIQFERKETKIIGGKNAINIRPKIVSESWGNALIVETMRACLRIRNDKIEVYMAELDVWVGECVQECIEIGDMPEEVKILDSSVRLKRLAEQEEKENGEV